MSEAAVEPDYESVGPAPEPLTWSERRKAKLARRPTGKKMMAVGWVVFLFGIATGYLAANANDLYDVAFFGCVAVFGAVMVFFGHLTRALFFLPGRIVTRGDL